ncbi:PREDICTED: uncharacterized protein LOC100636047 isoform X1 [Amphimedon queenslandica]|uniref:Uncharacterized protein n=1 Tax=Amphimedon queenslandica TaxID=400682 RepID=A0AAN0JNC6_AMPQE|nr:PREDICTED: uncharacterized protein LOC100636047 isoform X1 [Amphimedon queenslandica]|eukprot:XP_019858534.1 PREDICTED: uncharacterized protein LOC100636047 isoform X1 [Amphimedon queenslandica]
MADVKENGESESKKRRRGFDSGVDEMPEMEQTGELVTPATLPKLDSNQRHALSLAKKYAQEITAKHQQAKQSEVQVQQMQSLQEAANQQRALLLMSRIIPLDQYQEKLQERRREWEASQPVQPEDRRESH